MSENTDLKLVSDAGSALQAQQRRQYETVHCLLLPLNRSFGLLPNASVAEIIPYAAPDQVDDAPDWLLGMINWRERHLPVISLELASESEMGKLHKSCRIAIVNTLNGNARLPYFGILLQSLPSLQIVRPAGVTENEEAAESLPPSVKANVIVNGTSAMIPDLDDLESRLLRLLKS